MTTLARDVVIYKDLGYELLSPTPLVRPKDFGLLTSGHGPTHNPGGFLCTFVVLDSKLFLDSLTCSPARPSGWFDQVIHMFRKYPPAINRVYPVKNENGDILYDALSLHLKVTGKLVVGVTDSNQVDEIDPKDPGSYVEILKLSFEDGKLSKDIERIHGNLELPKRPSLRSRS